MVDQPPFIEAMQFLLDLTLKHKVGPTLGSEAAIQGGSYRAKRALSIISWSTPSSFPETLFKQVQIHLPFSKFKTHGVGGDHLSVNKSSKNVDRALEWCTTFCVDRDNRMKFLEISSVPAYDPLPIVQASPDGKPKTIALINLSRIKGMSPLPANTEGVVVFPQWYGAKASQFTQDTLTAALQSVLTGKATMKDAMTQAKQTIDAELAKKK
jgi:ABC-type glycerol-3-phosphate transport system substrate-binding protein